jgi:hypothetical protein
VRHQPLCCLYCSSACYVPPLSGVLASADVPLTCVVNSARAICTAVTHCASAELNVPCRVESSSGHASHKLGRYSESQATDASARSSHRGAARPAQRDVLFQETGLEGASVSSIDTGSESSGTVASADSQFPANDSSSFSFSKGYAGARQVPPRVPLAAPRAPRAPAAAALPPASRPTPGGAAYQWQGGTHFELRDAAQPGAAPSPSNSGPRAEAASRRPACGFQPLPDVK